MTEATESDDIVKLQLLATQGGSYELKNAAALSGFPPLKYGTFSNRMIATSIDLGLLFILVLPLVDMIMNQLFRPLDSNGLIAVMSLPEVNYDTSHLSESAYRLFHTPAFWNYLAQQHMLARIIMENLLQVIFIGLYIVPLWFRYSSTPGKMLLRLEIRDARSGEKMSDAQCILRFLGYIISTMLLATGFIWIGVDKKRRGFHDFIARTVVVVRPRKQKVKKAAG